MVNRDKVWGNIAELTGEPLETVRRVVTVEYWKNMVSFTHRLGPPLFSRYLHALEIKKLEQICGGVGVELPMERFGSESPGQTVQVYISDTYRKLFERDYADQFEFP